MPGGPMGVIATPSITGTFSNSSSPPQISDSDTAPAITNSSPTMLAMFNVVIIHPGIRRPLHIARRPLMLQDVLLAIKMNTADRRDEPADTVRCPGRAGIPVAAAWWRPGALQAGWQARRLTISIAGRTGGFAHRASRARQAGGAAFTLSSESKTRCGYRLVRLLDATDRA